VVCSSVKTSGSPPLTMTRRCCASTAGMKRSVGSARAAARCALRCWRVLRPLFGLRAFLLSLLGGGVALVEFLLGQRDAAAMVAPIALILASSSFFRCVAERVALDLQVVGELAGRAWADLLQSGQNEVLRQHCSSPFECYGN
jgi:hypothetical protein